MDDPRILQLWNLGRSTGEIADELGVTKNVIAGVLWRARQRGENVQRRTKAPPRVVERTKPRAAAVPVIAPKIETPQPEKPVSLLQHTDTMCRMLISTEPLLYCSKPRTTGAYCDEHVKGMYVKGRA